MRLFLCYVFPPLAVLFCGKPFTAILTLILTICGWYPGVQHALFIVNNHFQDKRIGGMTKAIHQPKWVDKMMPKGPRPPQFPMEEGSPLTWGWRKGRQLAQNSPIGRMFPPPPSAASPPTGDPNDPTVGANGTRFRRK